MSATAEVISSSVAPSRASGGCPARTHQPGRSRPSPRIRPFLLRDVTDGDQPVAEVTVGDPQDEVAQITHVAGIRPVDEESRTPPRSREVHGPDVPGGRSAGTTG